jgi:3-hydroxyisobutyrate dehydrogenase
MALHIGVIGVGNMGAPLAARLLERGFAVTVRDLRPEAEAPLAALGAMVAQSAAALAAAVDAICVVVVDAAQIEAALFTEPQPAQAALRAGQTVLLHSTIAPQEAVAVAQRLAALGVQVLDAPISGGPARARAGTLSLMAAGDDAAFASVQPVLGALGDRVFRVGRTAGQGAAMKLVNNLLAGVNLAAAAQAFALGARAGIDPRTMLEVVNASSGASWIGADRAARALAGDFAPRAHTRILAKDLQLALAFAQQLDVPVPLGEEAAAMFRAALAAGFGDADDAALFALTQKPRPL